jgi:hypothetical protein
MQRLALSHPRARRPILTSTICIGTLPRFHARDASGAEIAGMPWAKDANFSIHKLIGALID